MLLALLMACGTDIYIANFWYSCTGLGSYEVCAVGPQACFGVSEWPYTDETMKFLPPMHPALAEKPQTAGPLLAP